jgi:uncharacterized UPF0160 family protein
MRVATHNGPFHADDVLAWGLVRVFVDPAAELVRTRDPALLASADLVFDVGGSFDPDRQRFDHHQTSYTGPRSSAGMVVDWLESSGRVEPSLAAHLRTRASDYVDDVDNGRREVDQGVPCFAGMVEALNRGASTLAEFDAQFRTAGDLATALVKGLAAGHAEERAARDTVEAAMADAVARGSNVIVLEQYVRWKPAYFELGGADHPTDFVAHPGPDGSFRALAIPPVFGSFAQKVPFPEAWAGLVDDELERVSGVPGARFCHKNRFILVCEDRPALMAALEATGLARGRFA